MAWDDTFDPAAAGGEHDEQIELVGTDLRVIGTVSLGRFGRLTDLINASSGYMRVRDARILQPNGDPTDVLLPELMVDLNEISFIAQTMAATPGPGTATGFIEPVSDTSVEHRKARQFVIFTPGHTVSGKVYIFGQTDLAAFVDSTDPRFVPVVDATTRSLADRAIVSQNDFVLINRTQMIAAAETGLEGGLAAEERPEM
jgi:hypothetical protein